MLCLGTEEPFTSWRNNMEMVYRRWKVFVEDSKEQVFVFSKEISNQETLNYHLLQLCVVFPLNFTGFNAEDE